jgi:hypothetical protein
VNHVALARVGPEAQFPTSIPSAGESELPPMDDLNDQERRRLDDAGFLALEGLVAPDDVEAMRTRLEERLSLTPQDHAGTLIVGGLLDDEVFDPAWRQPRVLAAVEHVVGRSYRLTGLASRGLRPGHGQQALHVDWGGHVSAGQWYGCHAICALVDFRAENGATRVVPGSHRNPWMMKGLSDPRKPHPAERQLIGPAGTMFILNIHCYHSAVLNASTSARLALFAHFARRDSPLLLASAPAEPTPESLARHPEPIKALLSP